MPRVNFADLPDSARVWVFASDRQLRPDESAALLAEVDAWLDQWKAHGAPLRNAREWREDQFLAIGVDPSAEQASGCSIDALFRTLQQLGARFGTSLVAGGRVFYRDAEGRPRMAPRPEVKRVVTLDTKVFDTSLTDAASYRAGFERPARETWVRALVQQPA
jgi:hypothetical protein